jgi:hypothetical protein
MVDQPYRFAQKEDNASENSKFRPIQHVFVLLSLCADIQSGAITQLSSGRDFYQSPAMSGDGSRLAWVQWDHPNMPWDDTQLVVADVAPNDTLSSHLK